ncbi:hypothetical protein HDU96_001611 [Phlyctochytrium bullatum]|nr:hypothetical protein HDU96_001611 [Phlyctochytrium bullatum]
MTLATKYRIAKGLALISWLSIPLGVASVLLSARVREARRGDSQGSRLRCLCAPAPFEWFLIILTVSCGASVIPLTLTAFVSGTSSILWNVFWAIRNTCIVFAFSLHIDMGFKVATCQTFEDLNVQRSAIDRLKKLLMPLVYFYAVAVLAVYVAQGYFTDLARRVDPALVIESSPFRRYKLMVGANQLLQCIVFLFLDVLVIMARYLFSKHLVSLLAQRKCEDRESKLSKVSKDSAAAWGSQWKSGTVNSAVLSWRISDAYRPRMESTRSYNADPIPADEAEKVAAKECADQLPSTYGSKEQTEKQPAADETEGNEAERGQAKGLPQRLVADLIERGECSSHDGRQLSRPGSQVSIAGGSGAAEASVWRDSRSVELVESSRHPQKMKQSETNNTNSHGRQSSKELERGLRSGIETMSWLAFGITVYLSFLVSFTLAVWYFGEPPVFYYINFAFTYWWPTVLISIVLAIVVVRRAKSLSLMLH